MAIKKLRSKHNTPLLPYGFDLLILNALFKKKYKFY